MYWGPIYVKLKFKEQSSKCCLVTFTSGCSSWHNLRHKESTWFKAFLSYSFFPVATFQSVLVNNCSTVTEKLIRFELNFSYVPMGTWQGSDRKRSALHGWLWPFNVTTLAVESHFLLYLSSCWKKCHQILTQGSLGPGLKGIVWVPMSSHAKAELILTS